MITIGEGGLPKAVRVGVAQVDGKLWTSGTQDRVRTSRHLREPRRTLFVFDQRFSWLALKTTVTLLEGSQAAAQNLQLFRVMQNRPSGSLSWLGGELDEASFLQMMTQEGRLIYEFHMTRATGSPDDRALAMDRDADRDLKPAALASAP